MAQGGTRIPAAPSLIEINGPILAPCKHDGKPDAASGYVFCPHDPFD
jgi:hypothetical protein